jgi:acetolactate synthase-1/2/3 large subunit
VFREAFHIARTGRPGPVLIDVTKDAQQAPVVPDWDVSLNVPGFRAPLGIDSRAVRDAARLLTGAAKPLILAGQGVIISGATAELRALAERTGTPVVTTLHGIGAFPENHPLSIGMPGMHGWVHVNRAIQECDVLLSIGARFDDRVTGKASTFAPRARVIHIDVDPSEIGKNVKVAVAIVADARCALTALLGELPASDSVDEMSGRRAVTWLRNIRETQATHQHRQPYMRRPDTSELMPHDVYAALDAELNERGEYRVVTDVGQHQMWAAQLIEWRRPRTHITSGGAGTMGFAVPAAMGAAIANPGETIWAIVGDGGFQMTNQELATISQEGVRNVKVAIVNNGYLGMVRQWQQLFEGRRYSGTPLSGPSFAGLAEAYGLRGFTIDRIENAREAIRAAWDHDGSAVLDFRVEREANVFPLVPPGSSIGEMITRESAPA